MSKQMDNPPSHAAPTGLSLTERGHWRRLRRPVGEYEATQREGGGGGGGEISTDALNPCVGAAPLHCLVRWSLYFTTVSPLPALLGEGAGWSKGGAGQSVGGLSRE